MSDEPENPIELMLREMRAELNAGMGAVDEKIDDRCADFKSEMDLATRLNETREQLARLRRAVSGALISEHEARIRRIEDHLNLPPLKAG